MPAFLLSADFKDTVNCLILIMTYLSLALALVEFALAE
jgi:hypothetical protein